MEERGELGVGCKALLVLLLLLTAGLVVGAALAFRANRIEKAKIEETRKELSILRWFHTLEYHDLKSDSLSGVEGHKRQVLVWFKAASLRESRDAWNNPIQFRCPGPIHPKGFDLISAGANGVLEDGHGDDIVYGRDLSAGDLAAIVSYSNAR